MRSLAERVILKKLSACIFLFLSVVTTSAQSKEWLLENGDRVFGERVDERDGRAGLLREVDDELREGAVADAYFFFQS